jgi:hypothetical protein
VRFQVPGKTDTRSVAHQRRRPNRLGRSVCVTSPLIPYGSTTLPRFRARKDELDQRLIELINIKPLERCWMAVPEIVEWANIDGFRFGMSKRHPKYDDIHLDNFLQELRDPARSRSTNYGTIWCTASGTTIGKSISDRFTSASTVNWTSTMSLTC